LLLLNSDRCHFLLLRGANPNQSNAIREWQKLTGKATERGACRRLSLAVRVLPAAAVAADNEIVERRLHALRLFCASFLAESS